MQELFAEKFKSARLMQGFSLQDVADKMKIKISRQALHKYEKGAVVPDSEMVGVLAEALGVRPDYFFSKVEVELGDIEFRKLNKLPVKEENKILESAKEYLARYLELEQILNIESNFQNPLKGFREIQGSDDIEEAAEKVRLEWKLGTDPIFNVIELLEDNHIKVIFIEAGDAYDGMQTWELKHNVPIIAINQGVVKKDDRKRFTAMHELGHLLLPISKNVSEKQKEKWCHQFAAAILFPRDALVRELGKNRSRIHVQELGALKKQYGISMQAIIMRAKDLGVINDNYCKQLFIHFRQMNWKIEEPVEYIGVEQSNRFDQLLFRGLAEEIISISKAASLKNQKVAEFRQASLIVQ